jgi:cytochrome c oxidase assembly protein subunit 11
VSAPTPSTQQNRGVLKVALIVVAAAFLFGFAMVPIYRIACEHVLGIKLAENATSEAKAASFVEDDTRTIRVQFIASVNSKLPWKFQPEVPSVEVHPGKLSEAWFDATNNAAEAIVGNAVPSVAPNTASLYFNKTECFCFTEQLLKAGESRRMPVRFIVDPKLPKEITELTLSYTFYENTVATERVAATGSPLPAG